MQARAAEDLRKLVTDRLVEAGLVYEGAKAFVTPRRLALAVHGVPARQPDVREEKKGPRVGAPDNAIAGFLEGGRAEIDRRSQSAARQEGRLLCRGDREAGPRRDRRDRRNPARRDQELSRGRNRCAGARRRRSPGALTWVRPLHSIVATFGPETEEPDIVPFSVGGIAAGNETRGHRFLAPAAVHGAPARRLPAKARQGQGGARRRAAARHHPHRGQAACLRAGPRTGRGRGPARRSRGPRRMAGGADGLVRRRAFCGFPRK